MANTISLWASDFTTAIKPFPMQFQANIPPSERRRYKGLEKDPKKAFKKLRAYYRKLGFRRLEDSKLMILGPSKRTGLFFKLCQRA